MTSSFMRAFSNLWKIYSIFRISFGCWCLGVICTLVPFVLTSAQRHLLTRSSSRCVSLSRQPDIVTGIHLVVHSTFRSKKDKILRRGMVVRETQNPIPQRKYHARLEDTGQIIVTFSSIENLYRPSLTHRKVLVLGGVLDTELVERVFRLLVEICDNFQFLDTKRIINDALCLQSLHQLSDITFQISTHPHGLRWKKNILCHTSTVISSLVETAALPLSENCMLILESHTASSWPIEKLQYRSANVASVAGKAPSTPIPLTEYAGFVEQTARARMSGGVLMSMSLESEDMKELASALWEIVDG
ncbi:hypothetical protein DFJ58DRAFT_915360 [Suillus subalutaceus]|uniref:uncharacterized protein n=1 Tax=Suillus subalutaceus TaxID=48586 RepID=UPI001B87D019|nr:uncharacterized protein DFJ58DRAFT_915360 [Suillus subalutaceus]KAG1846585.1 hypothetical protein DFJ58DRAFT_915360 [Suillus subalutaceus]